MKLSLTILLLTLLVSIQSNRYINFPASFTIIRKITPPVNIDTIFQQLGCCKFDSNGLPNGYNMISLDGFQSTSTTGSIQTGSSPLSFWVNAFSMIAASKQGKGGTDSTSTRQYILDKLHQSGMKLLMNALAN